MDEKHKETITNNLAYLCKTVDYQRLRPQIVERRLLPERQLDLLEEKGSNAMLDLLLQVQRRGPTAFRRLVTSLLYSGHEEAAEALARDNGLLLSRNQSDCSHLHHTSIDLTDSPLQPSQIQVEPASVLREEDSMTYRMTSQTRGLALIIDNEDFETLPSRRGSSVDTDCLAKLYQQLGFFVVIKKNLRKLSFEFELFEFATDNIHHKMDMAVICILSHGENGYIICTDGQKISVEDILYKFNNRQAAPLKGKPKYFLFQACRGLKIDPGVETDGPSDTVEGKQYLVSQSAPDYLNHYSGSGLHPTLSRDPSFEDIFVSFATIPAYVAYRNNLKGSWFVQCLCRVFMMYSCTEDLETLLLRVTQELRAYCTNKGEKQINETLLRGVTKKLYFNPGLATTNWSPYQANSTASFLLPGPEKISCMEQVWSGLAV